MLCGPLWEEVFLSTPRTAFEAWGRLQRLRQDDEREIVAAWHDLSLDVYNPWTFIDDFLDLCARIARYGIDLGFENPEHAFVDRFLAVVGAELPEWRNCTSVDFDEVVDDFVKLVHFWELMEAAGDYRWRLR